VSLAPVHPSSLRDVVRDSMGHVKGYVIEEDRIDPDKAASRLTLRPNVEDAPTVKYTEVATRDGDMVRYQTYRDDAPYAWNGEAAEWEEPYGFIPLVVIPHIDVGADWGWSELHAGLPKFRELDDIASKAHDQVRKAVDPVWLFSGVSQPAQGVRPPPRTTDNPQPGRDDLPALYGPIGADAKALVADIDLAAVFARLDGLIAELERDYPEMDMSAWNVSSAASGAARRVARQRVEVRALERRASYDAGMIRAQQMAVAIGGMRGYPGYEGFGLDSYDSGALDHQIGARPVFPPDEADDEEIRLSFWQGIKTATEAGADLAGALEQAGMSPEMIAMLAPVQPEPTALPIDQPTPTGSGEFPVMEDENGSA
jgi:hypothetical protein